MTGARRGSPTDGSMRDGGIDGEATCAGRDGAGGIDAGRIETGGDNAGGADRDAMVRGGIDGDAMLIGAIREGGDATGGGGDAGSGDAGGGERDAVGNVGGRGGETGTPPSARDDASIAGITIVRYGSNGFGEGTSGLGGGSDTGLRIAAARADVSDADGPSGGGTSVVASPTEGTFARSLTRAARSSSVESATIVDPSFAAFSAPEARGISEIRAPPNARCANVVTRTHASSRGRPLSHARCGTEERTSSDAPSCMTTT